MEISTPRDEGGPAFNVFLYPGKVKKCKENVIFTSWISCR